MGKDEIKVGAVLSYIIVALTTLTGLLYTPYMLRSLGQSEFGLYMMIGSVVGYISILDLGMHNTIYRFVSKFQVKKDNYEQENFLAVIFIIYGIISLLVLAIGAVLASNLDIIFARSLSNDDIEKARLMLIILVLNLAVSLPLGAFQFIVNGYGKFIFTNSVIIIRIILRTVTFVGVLYLGYKSLAIVLVDTFFNLFMGIMYLSYSFIKLKVKIKLYSLNKEIIKRIFNYSFFVFLLAIVNQLFWPIGQVVLGVISSTEAVAVYALAISLTAYYKQVAMAISGLFMPKVSMLVETGADSERLTDLMVKVGRVQFTVLGLVLAGFIVLGKEFILLWAGEGYEQVYWISILIFIPLTVPMIQNLGGTILKAMDLVSFVAKLYLLMTVINIFTSVLLGRVLDAVGVGIATSISIIIFQVVLINIYYSKVVKLNIKRFFKETFKGLLLTMVITLVAGYLSGFIVVDSWSSLLIRVMIISSIYVTLLVIIGLNSSEKSQLCNFVKRIISKNIIKG